MLKILVASDNHRNESSLEDLLNIYDDIDLWLHCGDSEFGESHLVWQTFKTVRGNMDWENHFPEVRVENIYNTNFVILHGHKHQVKESLKPMEQVALENNAKIVFYGHTHIAKVDKLNDIYFINPGSIIQPRGNMPVGSYAIYEENSGGRYITYYDWNHNEINALSQKLV